MLTVRPSEQRGRSRLDWLDSRHTFSFADYSDSRHVHFRDLRVINEDWVDPSMGFGTHPHRDMEIITYLLDGRLAHRDSLGSGSELKPGEVQVMSAGTGITHSEFNPSREETAHLLQIWILPERKGITPRYDQKFFPENSRRGKFQPVASPDGREGSLVINQDVTLYLGSFAEGSEVSHALAPGRHAWLQVARGSVDLNGTALKEGDGAALSHESTLRLRATEDSEVLLFDLR
jgi:redox-sensitive bicupin YhaK (pirin superfamily)